ncbi:MAG: outer membrane beta-barrel protein [Elusimicrobiota bacterium]
MKKIVGLVVFVMLLSTALWAKPMYKVNLAYGILTSPEIPEIILTKTTKGGIGAGAQVLFGEEKIKYGAEIAYMPIYNYKDDGLKAATGIDIKNNMNAIPVLAVINYDLEEMGEMKPYLQGGLGLSFISAKSNTTGVEVTDNTSKFTFMLGAGMLKPLSDALDLDISVKYYNIATEGDTSSEVVIGAGVCF